MDQLLNESLLDRDVLYPVLGHLVGKHAGNGIPVIQGLPDGVSEDRLKALGAAAASSGSVGMFHAVGSTPEAFTTEEESAYWWRHELGFTRRRQFLS